MNEPQIDNFPTEMFGHPYAGHQQELDFAMRQQYCKYVHGTCVKPRKSSPNQKVGICSVGYKTRFMQRHTPVIICPQRLKEDTLFDTIRERYLQHWTNVEWVAEVNIGVGGSVDYVALTKSADGCIADFLCVELQAAGTTGSPYQAVADYQAGHRFSRNKYNYGINWANEFTKTMLQQAYKKGKIVEHWRRKIVFVVQDVAMSFIKNTSNVSRLGAFNPQAPVDFCSFSLVWNEASDSWQMQFNNIMSTDIDGVSLMLGGAQVDSYPTEDEFVLNIVKKGVADGVLDGALYKKLYTL